MAQTTTPPPAQIPPPQTTPKPAATPTPTPKPPPEPFPAGATVAYIDLQQVVTDSKLGKQGHDAMQALNDKLSGVLAQKNKDIQALQERIKQQQTILAQSAIEQMARDLEKMQREGQFLQQDSQVQIDQLQASLMTNFQDKVLPIVEALRKEKGLLMIFALGPNSNIAAAHVGLDLSSEVVKRLDAITK